ncbi:MAG TPA: hypothetical protein VFH67_04990 [bacterium]|nr:hypothetical protein [bacterium]
MRPVILLLACIVLGAGLPALAQATVQRVDVRVTFDEGAPHPLFAERLQAAAQSVVERLLVGRPIDQLQALQPRLQETVAAVLDRVATGYAVSGTIAQLGATSTVTLSLRRVGPVIGDATVRPDLTIFHPRIRPLAEGALQARAGEIRALVTNLPIAALEWAEPIAAGRAREIVEEALPGFSTAVRISAGVSATVELIVNTRDSRIVRNIGVRFRSTSIPTLLLDRDAPQVISIAEPLRGLPVVFAEAQRGPLARLIDEDLVKSPPVRQYRIVTTVGLDVGETTYVNVAADSLLYRARVEAHLNVGPRAPNPVLVAHLGRLVHPSTELFVEMRLTPNTLSMDWDVGAQYQLSTDAAIGLSYTVGAQSVAAWTIVRFGRDVSTRGKWNLTQQAFEGALTYRVNEFLAGEIIATSLGEVWLRLISNL